MANLTKIFAGLLFTAALVLGALAWMVGHRAPAAPVAQPAVGATQALTPVVVAARTLVAGQPIPADALRVKPLPIHPAGAFSDTALIVGRVPLADVAADTPVLDSQLTSSLAASLAPGERAVAVRVDELNAVGNQLRPGNFVDVFFTLRRDGGVAGGEVGRTQARLLISRARVLVFGNPDDMARTGTTQRTNNFGTQAATPRTAVLAVPLAMIDTLALAQAQGQLMLALRNPTDPDEVDPSAFGAHDGVLKVVARDGATATPSTRAAAGIALDQLAGGSAPRETPGMAPTRRTQSGAVRGGLEVIRGGRAETVAW
jgi:pilus assembly protein CpaB